MTSLEKRLGYFKREARSVEQTKRLELMLILSLTLVDASNNVWSVPYTTRGVKPLIKITVRY